MDKKLIEKCIAAYENGSSRMEVAKIIMNDMGLKISAAKVRAKTIWDNHFEEEYVPVVSRESEEEFKSEEEDSSSSPKDLEFSDKYIYNKDSGKYIFLLESKIGKNLVLSEDKVKSIIKSYSNFKGDQSSINEIAIKFDIPRKFVIEILKSLEITHDSLPVTNEDLSEKESDSLVEEILQEKRFALYQKLEKKDWIETKKQAEKWREFESGTLNPLQNYLEELDFKPLPKITPDYVNAFDDEDTIVIGVTDLQIGAWANEDLLYFGEGWNTEKAVQAVDDYARRVIAKAKKNGITKAVLVFGGDIFHGLNAETAKLTPLKCDTLHYDQFDATVKAVTGLIQRCAENFEFVDSKIIKGNHEGHSFYPLFRLVESIFQNSDHLSFDICKKEFMHFRVKNSLFILHHGASGEYRFKVPSDAKGRKELVHRVLRIAEREGKYKGIQRVFFVQGDIHHFQCIDYGQFTFYVFGALPTGDEYADALALESTPTQNALVLGDGKDYSTLHITF
jgi:hypothetical protein